MSDTVAVAVITSLITGGMLTAFVGLLRFVRQGGAEKDSIVAQGAQSAVLALQQALEAEKKEVAELRRRLDIEHQKRLLIEQRLQRAEEDTAKFRTKLRAIETEAARMHEELLRMRRASEN